MVIDRGQSERHFYGKVNNDFNKSGSTRLNSSNGREIFEGHMIDEKKYPLAKVQTYDFYRTFCTVSLYNFCANDFSYESVKLMVKFSCSKLIQLPFFLQNGIFS